MISRGFASVGCGSRRPWGEAGGQLLPLLLVTLLASPVLLYGLGDYSIVNGDEAIYHYMARRMLETGDWLHLEYAAGERRVYDTFMNAPVHYWAKALVLLVFGDSKWSMRILSACFGWLSLLVTYRLTERIAGRGAGFLAAVVQLTTFQFVYLHSARTGEMEAILACLFGATAHLFLRALHEGRSFVPHHLCLIVLLNLKAPIAIPPLLAELAFFALASDARPRAKEWARSAAALLPLGLVWHAYQAASQWGEFLEVLHTMRAEAGGSSAPGAGLLGNAAFYSQTLLFGAFPHVVVYPIAIGTLLAGSRDTAGRAAARLLALYPAMILAFFVVVAKSNPWYIVPAYPFVSAFTGIWLDGLRRAAPRPPVVATTALALALIASLRLPILSFDPFVERATAISGRLSWWTPDLSRAVAGVALGSSALALALWGLGRRLSARHRALALASLMAATLLGIGGIRVLVPLRATDRVSEMERLREELRRARAAGLPVATPIAVKEPGLLKAKYFFGDDFEIVPRSALPSSTRLPEEVRFLLTEREPAPGASSSPAGDSPATGGCGVPLHSSEALANPTRESVEVSVIFAADAEAYVEYGSAGGPWSRVTHRRRVAPEEPLVLRLDGLEADREYRYRVRCRRPAAPGRRDTAPFGAGEAHSFRTLRRQGSTVRFGFATDSHVYQGWVHAHCGGDASELAPFDATLGNVLGSGLDFLILGGDEVQTHCRRCPPCVLDGESTGGGTVRSDREALLRYRIMRRAYERVSPSIPVFLTLGNHDGEAGFASEGERCHYFENTLAVSRSARLAHFPSPAAVYGGGGDGRYYAFESGDALFVVLDVMGQTQRMPTRPEDWSLGEAQMRWLEQTLARSERRWKLLFAHHLVGGSEMELCYTYGRGGIRETRDGTATGSFRGEQARVQELMGRYGAQGFFYGHDHVFAVGEKRDAADRGEPILYLAGGQAAGREIPAWTGDAAFQSAYDFDQDGRPDYLLEKGFVRVTVEGARSLTIEYVGTDADDPRRNGNVLFRRVLHGPSGLPR